MKKNTRIIAALSASLALAVFSSAFQSVNAEKHKSHIVSFYSKSFYELTEHIEKINLSLKKAALTIDAHSLLSIGSYISESASFALSDLSEMEASTPLTNINTFLNQAGDYVKTIAIKASDGEIIGEKERDTLLMLSDFSEILKNELHFLRGKIAAGEITYSSALIKADETLGDHLSRIENEHFSDYESLTYDGSFSSHMEKTHSPYLSSLPEIGEEEALRKAISYLYSNVPFVYRGETEGDIPSYMFSADGGNSHYAIEISKKGGKLLYYSENRAIKDSVVSNSEALSHALSFATDAGYGDLTFVFYEKSGNTLAVTLAPFVNGVIYYTDIIKVTVALDTASVIGFNSENYLINHKDRIFPEVSPDITSLISNVDSGFIAKEIKPCYIPTGYNSEIPCIEVSGTFNDDTFLIYINAKTGKEEEILLLSESDESYFAK